MFGQHRSECNWKRVVMVLIHLDYRYNEINGPFESRLLHKRMCDSQCGTMVSSLGGKVPEASLQFMNWRMDDHFRELLPGNTGWQNRTLLVHNQPRLYQAETFPFGSSGGRTVLRKPFSQWTTMH